MEWLSFYIDGKGQDNQVTPTLPAANFGKTATCYIGEDGQGSDYWKGYFGPLRISNSARYTADFDVPTTVWTNDGNTKLLIQNGTDGSQTFTDSSSSSHSITVNGDARWFAPKVGAGAMAFDGTGDYFKYGTDVADFEFGAGDFTVECWMQKDSGSSYEWDNCAIAYGDNTAAESSWKIYAPDYIEGYVWSGTTAYNVTATTDTDDNAWHHVALARDGATLRLYIDGTQEDTVSVSGVTLNSHSSAQMVVGWDAGSAYYTGYLDDVRVSSFCRYPDGTTFTPSTTMLTDDINTALLLNADINQGTWAEDSSTGLAISTDSRMKFDGTGDELSTASSSDFEYGTGDFTHEAWIYPTAAGSSGGDLIIYTGTDSTGNNSTWLSIDQNRKLDVRIAYAPSSWASEHLSTNTIDLNQWTHVALVRQSGTCRVYIDGVQDSTFSNSTDLSATYGGRVGIGNQIGGPREFTGYMDEIRLSNSCRYPDGTTFTLKTRGEPFTADANTKLLIHSDYTGGLGADSSGNFNNFTATNLVATDQMIDTPTNNFATLNPLATATYAPTYGQGNLEAIANTTDASVNNFMGYSTIGFSSGKWYAEYVPISKNTGGSGNYIIFGITDSTKNKTTYAMNGAFEWGYSSEGVYYHDGSSVSTGFDTYTLGDIISCAVDLDNNKIYWAKNGTWQNSADPAGGTGSVAITSPAGGDSGSYFFELGKTSTSRSYTSKINFGADSSFSGSKTAQGNQDGNDKGDFYYEPPSGFLALCEDNLNTPEIKLPGENFNTVLYTGTGSELAVTGVGFQPDLTIIRARQLAYNNRAFDSVRGVTKELYTNSSGAEVTDTESLKSFDSDGFTLGDSSGVNPSSSSNMVSWNWYAPTSVSGSTVSSGTAKTYSGKANAGAGFSITKYEGNGTNYHWVPHSLGVAPELAIVRKYGGGASEQWPVLAWNFTSDIYQTFKLDNNAAQANAGSGGATNAVPNSTYVKFGLDDNVNSNGVDMIMYCFASIGGYSKVGSYEGNSNTDGSFIYTGFSPGFVILKTINGTGNWNTLDNKRDPYNVVKDYIYLNATDVNTPATSLDFLSNGFKLRINDSYWNDSSYEYLYIAFAESPFKYSNAR